MNSATIMIRNFLYIKGNMHYTKKLLPLALAGLCSLPTYAMDKDRINSLLFGGGIFCAGSIMFWVSQKCYNHFFVKRTPVINLDNHKLTRIFIPHNSTEATYIAIEGKIHSTEIAHSFKNEWRVPLNKNGSFASYSKQNGKYISTFEGNDIRQ